MIDEDEAASASARERASASSRWITPAFSAFAVRTPFSEKSEPVATECPSTWTTFASKASEPASMRVWIDQ